MAATTDPGVLVLVDQTRGVTLIPQLAELRRLNWFDGKLLRADDLRVEQDHVRALVRRANQAGGAGVVHGFTCALGGGRIAVSPGLAIDASGRSLLLPAPASLDAGELIERTAARPPAATPSRTSPLRAGFDACVEPLVSAEVPQAAGRWYLITVGWAEALCGTEDVYGKLCEDACTQSTDRPWRLDGLVFRAHPLRPRTPLATSAAVALDDRHERSLLASALFADERDATGALLSAAGLRSGIWCAGAGGIGAGRDEVALGVLARAGDTSRFLDVWTARRERMEPPPQRHWEGRVAMRPWDAFLAQVLQFQCQLADVLAGAADPGGGEDDPCEERQRVLEDALEHLGRRVVDERDADLDRLRERAVALRAVTIAPASQRILVDGGIVELPPAGYLPVAPAGPPAIEQQLRALLGAGVDLTFCAARHDAVARCFEEARHLDRISLLRGLDDPRHREDVEIVVPDADVEHVAARDAWAGALRVGAGGEDDDSPRLADRALRAVRATVPELDGAGRVERRSVLALRWAGTSDAGAAEPRRIQPSALLEASTGRDPFALDQGDELPFTGAADLASETGERSAGRRFSFRGTLRVAGIEQRPAGALLRGTVDGIAVARAVTGGGPDEPRTWPADRLPVLLARRRTDDGGTLVALRAGIDENTALTVTLTWHGDADAVEVVAYVADTDRDGVDVRRFAARASGLGREIARLRLDREPGAGTPGNPAREAAETASRVLERVLREPGYAADARRRLFPGDDDGIRLRATRDWVLFRRRAPLRCGPVAPPAVATETFAVFGAARRGGGEALAGGFVRLGTVAFAQGSSAPAGSTARVVRAWEDAAEGGEMLVAGVVAGAPGGDDLGIRRADRLADDLAAVTPRAAGYVARVVEPDEVDLDPEGADGILLFAAHDRPAQPTVDVAVAAVARSATARYERNLQTGDLPRAMVEAFEVPHLLGTIAFEQGGGRVARPADLDAVVAQARAVLGDVSIHAVDVVSVTGDPAAETRAVREARADAVARALGEPRERRVLEGDDAILDEARNRGIDQRTVLLLAPEVVELPEVRAFALVVDPLSTASYLRNVELNRLANAMKAALAPPHLLGPVAFAAGGDQAVRQDELDAIAERHRQELQGQAIQVVHVWSVTGEDAGGDLRIGRGKAVAEALGGAGDVGTLEAADAVFAQARDAGIEERILIVAAPIT